MQAFWVNKSTDTVPDIELHLYMNAFRNNRTTLKEAGSPLKDKESEYGWIDIKSFTDRNGNDLIPGMKYISPDDGKYMIRQF